MKIETVTVTVITHAGGAAAVGRLVGLQGHFSVQNDRQCCVTEVHLSHNNVTNKGLGSFLESSRGTYPYVHTHKQQDVLCMNVCTYV